MRVLMTADAVGGVWTYALELAAALAPHGADVTLATMGALPSIAQVRAAAAIPNLELVESAHALEWMPDPWRDVDAAGDWLLWLAQRACPDVIHLNGYVHATLPFAAPVVAVTHSDVCTWHRAVRGADAGPEWDEYRARVARGLRAADAIVGPTAAIARAVLAAHGVDVARARVIANGRAADRFRPAPKEPFVLAAGRAWDEAKGLDVLAACAPAVPWPVRIAGPTAAPTGAANHLDLRGVQLLGELAPDELARWMGRAAIFCAPARYEPFGLAPLEAALAGCALVLGDLDTLREVWGDAALYVPPGDRDALAHAIGRLAGDPARRATMVARARARAQQHTPARMAAAYRALYDEVCGRAAAREAIA